jgi:hypothetical protein
MAKTRKKDIGKSPRGFAAASEVDRSAADLADAPTPAAAGDERDRIAARAYELYLERGGTGGDAMDDWLTAEREFSNGNPDRQSGE